MEGGNLEQFGEPPGVPGTNRQRRDLRPEVRKRLRGLAEAPLPPYNPAANGNTPRPLAGDIQANGQYQGVEIDNARHHAAIVPGAPVAYDGLPDPAAPAPWRYGDAGNGMGGGVAYGQYALPGPQGQAYYGPAPVPGNAYTYPLPPHVGGFHGLPVPVDPREVEIYRLRHDLETARADREQTLQQRKALETKTHSQANTISALRK
ncbi:hypothetical protein LTR53_017722, partial [Teratosphaeriaceae sp. CCFEE 6253]